MIIGSLLFIFITRLYLIIILSVTIEEKLSLAASLPYMAPQYDDSDYMSYDEFVRSNNNRNNHNTNYRRDTSASVSASAGSNNNNNNNLLNNNNNNNNLVSNNLLNSNANLKEQTKNFKEMLKPRRQTLSKQSNYNNLKNAVSKVQRPGRSNYIVGGVNSDALDALNRLNSRSACPSKTTPENVEQLTCLIQAMHENTLALIKNLGDLEMTLLGACKRNEELKKKCRLKSTTCPPKPKCNDDDDDVPDMCRDSLVAGDESPSLDRFLKRREPTNRFNSFSNDRSKNFIAETQGAIQAWESQLSDTRKLLNDFAVHKSKKSAAFNAPSWEASNNNNNNYKSINNNNLNSNINSNTNSGYG